MKQYNNAITIKEVVDLKTFKQKIIGLIGANKPVSMYMQTRWGIHTFGMKFPIDVIILDDEYKVKQIRENLKPYCVFIWNPAYKNVLELPAGTIQNNKIKLGSIIDLITKKYKA